MRGFLLAEISIFFEKSKNRRLHSVQAQQRLPTLQKNEKANYFLKKHNSKEKLILKY